MVEKCEQKVPQHVAIIMDGNGRWAQARGKPRLFGHHAGARRVREIVECCPKLGVKYLTIFAFSTENWKRTQAEVSGLMKLFKRYLVSETKRLVESGVRVRFIGDRIRLDETLVALMDELELLTCDNDRVHLTVALNYGGRDEVARLAESFNRSADKIENLVNAHRLLLANASHELRTPLSRIRLGIDLLQKEADPARRDALEQDIAELDQLIDEILLMSRLDAGTHAEMNDSVDLLALAAEECVHYDDCQLTGDGAEVKGDQALLRRMLRNLLDNADKHGRPPGVTRIESPRSSNSCREVAFTNSSSCM